MTLRGTTKKLDVSFYADPGGPLVDPDVGPALNIWLDDVVVLTPDPGDIVRDSLGQFHYDWAIPSDAAPGTYVIAWSATLPGDSTQTLGYSDLIVTAVAPGLPEFGGCIWPMDPGCLTEKWNSYDELVQQRAVSLASATLTRLTAGRVGNCPLTLRPDAQRGSCGFPYGPVGLAPVGLSYALDGGFLRSWGVGRYDLREIDLPAPVYRVEEVRIDGVIVPPTDYRVFDRKTLRYTGVDYDAWPATQDWDADEDEAGWFSVTYLNTAPVDSQGAHAAGLLAAEFAKACTSADGKCKFPSNITTITRQGMSIDFISGSFPNGVTGIREADTYIAQWNRNGRQPATLIDPGAPQHRIVTG